MILRAYSRFESEMRRGLYGFTDVHDQNVMLDTDRWTIRVIDAGKRTLFRTAYVGRELRKRIQDKCPHLFQALEVSEQSPEWLPRLYEIQDLAVRLKEKESGAFQEWTQRVEELSGADPGHLPEVLTEVLAEALLHTLNMNDISIQSVEARSRLTGILERFVAAGGPNGEGREVLVDALAEWNPGAQDLVRLLNLYNEKNPKRLRPSGYEAARPISVFLGSWPSWEKIAKFSEGLQNPRFRNRLGIALLEHALNMFPFNSIDRGCGRLQKDLCF